MKLNLRDKRTLLIAMGVTFLLLFSAGIGAAVLSRNDTICPDHKAPLAKRGGLLGQTEYLCHGGKVVTK